MKEKILSVAAIVCVAVGLLSYVMIGPEQEVDVYLGYGSGQSINVSEEITRHQEDTKAAWQYRLNEDEKTVTISRYTGSEANVIVPGTLDGKTVTGIDNGTFLYCSSMEKLELPKEIISIEIGKRMFSGCNSFTDIKVSPDNPCYESEYGILYNKGKTELICCPRKRGGEIFHLPESLEEIGEYAFFRCENLTDIQLPESVRDIGQYAFMNCKNLRSVSLPDGLTFISLGAFEGCSSLTDICLPEEVTGIATNAFRDCVSLESIGIPNGVTFIGYSAFEGCESLREMELPDSVESIGEFAFKDCIGLREISLPKYLGRIYEMTFLNCKNLVSIAMPESINFIYGNAFEGCGSLINIYYPKDQDSWEKVRFSGFHDREDYLGSAVVLFGEAEEINEEEQQFTEGDWVCRMNDDKETVSLYGYKGEENDIKIPKTIRGRTVTGIEDGIFSEWVKSVTLSENIEYINHKELIHLSPGLKEIYVSEDNPHYASENGILYNKEKTELIRCPKGKQGEIQNLPDGLITIGDYAFQECTYLTDIRLPDGVKGIGTGAFEDCVIESIRLPDSLEYIKDDAFYRCWEFTTVITIPRGVNSIGSDAFLGTRLKEISVSKENQTYASEDGILYNKEKTRLIFCPREKQGELLHLPESLKSIGDWAFTGCTGLTKIILPEGLIGIGDRAFAYCENLTDIRIPEGVVSIGNGAFCYAGLESVELPEGLKRLGKDAFLGCGFPASDISLPEGLELKGVDTSGRY